MLACHRGSGSATPSEPEPEPAEGPVAQLPTFPIHEPPPTPLDLSPDPLPEGVVAAVDGEPIFEVELERLVQAAMVAAGVEDPMAVRTQVLIDLVERRLLLAKADQMDIRATEDEVQHAIDEVATASGVSTEQLREEISQAGWTWDDYYEDLVAQIVEHKVLSIHGIYPSASLDPEAVAALRSRFLGCLRARAEVQVGDDSLQMPDNPFALVAEIAELRFTGDLGVPEDELRSVAMEAAKTRMRLCDALTSAELAVQEFYFERGYLDADIQIPWPVEPSSPVNLEVRVTAGPLHLVGKISFDQSAIPRRKRLDTRELRKRVAAYVTEGDVAVLSTMQAMSAELSGVFEREGLGMVDAKVKRKEGKKTVRMNITYRLRGRDG
ncbi:MAG: SurA N-terminal domain-containing protein [Myxococcota bacterium]